MQGPQTVSHVRDGIDMGGPWKEEAVLSAKTGSLMLPEENLTWRVGHTVAPQKAACVCAFLARMASSVLGTRDSSPVRTASAWTCSMNGRKRSL